MAVEGENARMGISLEIVVNDKSPTLRLNQAIDRADTHNYHFSVFPFPVDEPQLGIE